MPQKYKFSYTYANITAKMWHFSAKMPHFLGVYWVQRFADPMSKVAESPINHLRIT